MGSNPRGHSVSLLVLGGPRLGAGVSDTSAGAGPDAAHPDVRDDRRPADRGRDRRGRAWLQSPWAVGAAAPKSRDAGPDGRCARPCSRPEPVELQADGVRDPHGGSRVDTALRLECPLPSGDSSGVGRADHHRDCRRAAARPDVEREEILYDLSMELHRNKHVSDETYARALGVFGQDGIIEAVAIDGYYSLLARVMNTARTPLRQDVPPPPVTLPTFPR